MITNFQIIIMEKERKELLVLDINGILCRKIQSNTHIRSSTGVPSQYIVFPRYKVEIRSGIRFFLKQCYERYNVAFYSSTTEKNAMVILKRILTKNQLKNTIFFWFREKTIPDPEDSLGPLSGAESYKTLKMLSFIYEDEIFNSDKRFTAENTIIVDDDAVKVRLNNEENVIVTNYDKNLEVLSEDIVSKFKSL